MFSGRFAIACHALTLLATMGGSATSAFMAGSVNTHAVHLRRVLKLLADAGLIVAREGRGGHYQLALPPEKITLEEVYRAVETEGPLAPSPAIPSPYCPVGSKMQSIFSTVQDSARTNLLTHLSGQTLASLVTLIENPSAP